MDGDDASVRRRVGARARVVRVCVFRWWCFLSRVLAVGVVFGRQGERETDGTVKDYFEFGGLTVARGLYIYIYVVARGETRWGDCGAGGGCVVVVVGVCVCGWRRRCGCGWWRGASSSRGERTSGSGD